MDSIEEKTAVSPEDQVAASPQAQSDLQVEKRAPVRKRLLSTPSIVIILVSLLISVLLSSYIVFQNELKKYNPSEPIPQPITKTNTLIVATDATFPPMEFIDKSGEIVGYDIDLGRRIAAELGMKAEFKNVKWEDIFNSLERQDVGVIISSVSITDERKKKYNFSNPYLNNGQVIITNKTNLSVTTPLDLVGKRIGVQNETVSEPEALKYTSKELVIPYENTEIAALALEKGTVNAIITDLTGAKGLVTEHQTLKIVGDPFTTENYGIVFRKDEIELVNKVNAILELLRQKGILADLKQKWLE